MGGYKFHSGYIARLFSSRPIVETAFRILIRAHIIGLE
jgi:hypothetical protein